MVICKNTAQVVDHLKQAVALEPSNQQLHMYVDLLLRIMCSEEVPDRLWKAEVPKSLGLVKAMAMFLGDSTGGSGPCASSNAPP